MPRPDSFTEGLESFTNYKERLDAFFIANDVAESKHASTLLSSIGPKTYNTLRSLTAPDLPSTKTYAQLCALLTNHFCPPPLEIVERFKFHRRNQGLNESLSDYLAEIKRLSEHCNFGISLQTSLRDRFVCGIKDEAIQKQLLQEQNLTLERATSLALAMETAHRDAAEIHGDSTAIHRINAPRTSKYPQQSRKTFPPCQTCGLTNHKRSDCYLRDAICKKCSKKGHIQKVCKAKGNSSSKPNFARNHQMDNEESSDTPSEQEPEVFSLYHVASRADKIWVNPTINRKKVKMELDTGSALSIMTMDQYKEIFKEDPNLKETNIILKTYTDEKINPLGYAKVKVELNGQTEHLSLYILKKGSNPIFGRDWLTKLQIDWHDVKQMKSQTHAASDQKIEIKNNLMQEFPNVFSSGIGNMTKHQVSLRVKPDANPKFFKARTVPYALKQKIERELDNLAQQGIISQISKSEWATPIVPLLKSNGDIRICGDYKITINPVLEEESYTLPRMEDMMVDLEKGEKFSKIDIRKAYLTLPLTEACKGLTTINTHKGLYCFNRLVFGVTSSPAIWQRTMDQVLQGLKGVQCNQDDILITGHNDEQHIKNLKAVLARLEEHGLKANIDKCKFLEPEVVFCGIKISSKGLHKTDDKIKAVIDAPIPMDKTQLRSFLGLVNYYHKWLQNVAQTAKPLYDLLQNDKKFEWTAECSKAFTDIKELVASDKVLIRYDPNLELRLACDASPYGIGSVLSHVTKEGEERPIAYSSRTLNSSERNYSQLDKEALAIVWSVKKFYNYLCARHFTLISDHLPLKYIFDPKKGIPAMSAARQQRYAAFLSGFNYSIEYRRSEQNANADSLSRLPLPTTAKDEDSKGDDLFYTVILESSPVNALIIAKESRHDPVLSKVITYVKDNDWPSEHTVPNELMPFFNKKNELTCQQDCLLWGHRVIPPEKLKEDILETLHSGHLGIVKMKNLARGYIWWHNIDKDIERMAKLCNGCAASQPDPPKAPLHPWHWPEKAWQRIHIDFAGPFMNSMFLIVVDAHSKWVEIIPTNNTTSHSTIEILSCLFARYGLCEQLVCDNGPQLASTEFKTFLKHHGVKQIFSPPYHPATNGLAERMVKTFKNAMKSAKNDKGTIYTKLSKFLLAYRNAPHASTNETPSFLMFGRRLRTPLDILRPSVKSRALISQEQQMTSHTQRNARQFSIGDRVFVRDYRGHQRWQQAVVKECKGPRTFRVEIMPGISWHRHVDQMIHTDISTDVSRTAPVRSTIPPFAPEVSTQIEIPPAVSIPIEDNVDNDLNGKSPWSSVEFPHSPIKQAKPCVFPVGTPTCRSIPQTKQNTPYKTRSGRVVRKPNKYTD